MPEILNVFEHQRFLLRRPDGTRVKKSFREILTEADDAYALDYPQEFYDVAALDLLVYLTQWVFEPDTVRELAARVVRPLTEAQFEAAVARWRSPFALTGEGLRFMQGPPVEDDEKAEPLAVAVLIAPKGDRQFLYRSDADWAVSPEQAGLFLFTRNTFYEGTGGRGYQKGTNGDTPIRTLLTVPGEGDAIHLRQSIWLNVLARETQRTNYPGDFSTQGEGYDGLFWEQLPDGDVPVGGITLRAGLGWMTAFHWLHFEETEADWICPVTGETISGLVAPRATKSSTGIAYGSKGDMEAGVRAERLFRHPNVPTRFSSRNKKTGDLENLQAYSVDRSRGLIDALGAAFFGARAKSNAPERFLAPVVAQLHAQELYDLGLTTRLLVFGFHMLSSQKNVHGGYELDTFAYRLLGRGEAETLALMDQAQERMATAGLFANAVSKALQRAIQVTAGAGVRARENEEGRILLERTETVEGSGYAFGRDALADYWHAVQRTMHDFMGWIAEAAAESPDGLTEQQYALQQRWEETLIREARRLYGPIFDHYSTLPRTMPYAHAARKMFSVALKNAQTVKQEAETL